MLEQHRVTSSVRRQQDMIRNPEVRSVSLTADNDNPTDIGDLAYSRRRSGKGPHRKVAGHRGVVPYEAGLALYGRCGS